MFRSKWFFIILILSTSITGIVIYKRFNFHKNKNEVAYIMQTSQNQNMPTNTRDNNKSVIVNSKKIFGNLIITNGVPSSQDMASGVLCIENSSNLEKVDLYMPDMGHGSEPPKVTSIKIPIDFVNYSKSVPNFGCYSVESMQLFMPGIWQVRVFYKDGNTGIFTIELNK